MTRGHKSLHAVQLATTCQVYKPLMYSVRAVVLAKSRAYTAARIASSLFGPPCGYFLSTLPPYSVCRVRHTSKSSKLWLERQATDHYSQQAKTLLYRSRAAFKLLEMDDKYKIFDPSVKNVVDLGFAPGAWSQVALERMKGRSHNILGVDLIPCSPPQGCHFLEGDILSRKTQTAIRQHFSEDDSNNTTHPVDLIMSDMMANSCGIKNADHIASMDLCDGALILTAGLLREGGTLVMKFFTGREENLLVQKMDKIFRRVRRFKPKACRPELQEMYIIGTKRRKGPVVLSEIF